MTTISRFELEDSWITRILSDWEIKESGFYNIISNQRKKEILASRWACKEAIKKLLNINLPFSKIVLVKNSNKSLIYDPKNGDSVVNLTISHEKDNCIAIAYIRER